MLEIQTNRYVHPDWTALDTLKHSVLWMNPQKRSNSKSNSAFLTQRNSSGHEENRRSKRDRAHAFVVYR